MDLLDTRLQLLILGLTLTLMMGSAAWALRFFQIPEQQRRSPPLIRLHQVLLGFLIFFGIQISIILLASLGLRLLGIENEPDQSIQGWVNVGVILIDALCLVLYVYSLDSRIWKTLWGGRQTGLNYRLKDYLIGASTLALAIPVTLVVGQFIGILVSLEYKGTHVDQEAVRQLKMLSNSPLLFAVMGMLIGTLIPVMEELLFRGLLQNWLSDRISRLYAIPLTAIIFALFHMRLSQGIDNIEIVASLFTLACFLGYVYERQQSLWASIGLHSLFNSVNILLIARSL